MRLRSDNIVQTFGGGGKIITLFFRARNFAMDSKLLLVVR